jgi:hypothetical protein
MQDHPINIEDVFTQISLDVLGQAVFEHDFDALSKEDEFFKVRQHAGKLLWHTSVRITWGLGWAG